MDAHKFDLDEYLKLTGVDPTIGKNSQPNLDLLTTLVSRHVSTVHYQNYDLLTQKKILDMTPGALLHRLLVCRRGGMCYETSELMFHVLMAFKFDVKRVAVVVLAGMPYNESQLKDHNVLIVHLEGRKYLVDVGFGYNSLRAPIEFTFEITEEKSLMDGEKYQLFCADEYYQLNFWLKGAWASFYRIKRPLTFINLEESMQYYHGLVNFPGTTAIRDLVLYVGVISDDGRHGFSCDYDSDTGATNFSILKVRGSESESCKMDVSSFIKMIRIHLNIDMKYITQGNVIKFV